MQTKTKALMILGGFLVIAALYSSNPSLLKGQMIVKDITQKSEVDLVVSVAPKFIGKAVEPGEKDVVALSFSLRANKNDIAVSGIRVRAKSEPAGLYENVRLVDGADESVLTSGTVKSNYISFEKAFTVKAGTRKLLNVVIDIKSDLTSDGNLTLAVGDVVSKKKKGSVFVIIEDKDPIVFNVIKKEVAVVPLTPVDALLTKPKIAQAVGDLSESDREFLNSAYDQLISGETSSWYEYDNYGPYDFSYEDIRKIWLRRVAFSFYVELTKNLPWSLESYEQEDLSWMLSFCTDFNPNLNKDGIAGNDYVRNSPYPCGQYFRTNVGSFGEAGFYHMIKLIEPNPLQTYEISQKIMNYEKVVNVKIEDGPDAINNQKNFIDKAIIGMRKRGWSHYSTVDQVDGMNPYPIITAFNLSKGSSHVNAHFLADISRTWNIPAIVGNNQQNFGHGSIIFPSENIGLYSGDDVQSEFVYLPVKESYFTESYLYNIFDKNVCDVDKEKNKAFLERLFSYRDDPQYSYLVYTTGLSYGPTPSYCESGKKFVESYVNSFQSVHCDKGAGDSQCLGGKCAGIWQPALTSEEIDQWTNTLFEDHICGENFSLEPKTYVINSVDFSAPLQVNNKISISVTGDFLNVRAWVACGEIINANLKFIGVATKKSTNEYETVFTGKKAGSTEEIPTCDAMKMLVSGYYGQSVNGLYPKVEKIVGPFSYTK